MLSFRLASRLGLYLIAVVWPPRLSFGASNYRQDRLSVLMIVIDDLRAGLSDGDTGRNLLSTPHLDTLAARGVKFTRAYAQYALCSPSRSSALTGTRPDTTLVFDLTTHFRQHLPSVVTLPEHFKQHGYFTFGAGKIFHRGLGDDERAWSLRSQPAVDRPAYAVPLHSALDKARKQASREEISDRGKEEKTRRKSGTSRSGVGGTPLHTTPLQRGGKVRRGPVLEVGPRNATFHDHVVADEVIAALRRAAPAALLAAGWPSSTGGETNQRDKVAAQPFFIVAGFIRPHLPWVAPESFWDLYSDRTRRDGEGSSTRGGGGSSKETAKANVRPPSFPRPIPLGGAVSPLDAAPGKKVPEFALQGAQHSELSAYFGVPPHLLHRQDEQSHSAAKLQSLQQQQQQQQQQLGGATDEEGTAGSSTPATSLVPPQPVVSEASMRRGYAACTSFVDEQAGRVLSELDLLGLSLGSAAVVVWGDHGFRLGEQGQWGKNSNSELDTLVPLTVALPPDWLSRRAASLHLPPPWAQRNHVNGDGGGGASARGARGLVPHLGGTLRPAFTRCCVCCRSSTAPSPPPPRRVLVCGLAVEHDSGCVFSR